MGPVLESASVPDDRPIDKRCLNVALVNNMPDAALLQTERQFTSLLRSGDANVRLRTFTLPGVPRQPMADDYIRAHYAPLEQLWESSTDALIVTGSEPLSAELQGEPYWSDLERLLDWAGQHAVSTIVSCLAAHALLALDGIDRVRLPTKRSGVFDQHVTASHLLAQGLPASVAMPHSRLNDVPTASIVGKGYQPLISSPDIGWTVATKDIESSLFVLVQGHPEYELTTLLTEYRRDVRRYLNRERPVYPELPTGYLQEPAQVAFAELRAEATHGARSPALMKRFPFEGVAATLDYVWRPPAEQLYANWLTEVARRSRKVEIPSA